MLSLNIFNIWNMMYSKKKNKRDTIYRGHNQAKGKHFLKATDFSGWIKQALNFLSLSLSLSLWKLMGYIAYITSYYRRQKVGYFGWIVPKAVATECKP